MRLVQFRYSPKWLAIFAFVVVAFWLGYWLGGTGGEMAEFKDRFSWTGFALGLMCAIPIGLFWRLNTYDRPPVAPWRQFDELRNQLNELERFWKESGDEYERVVKKLAELQHKSVHSQDDTKRS